MNEIDAGKRISAALLVNYLRRSLDHYVGEPQTAESVRTYLEAQIDMIQSDLPPNERTKIVKITPAPDGAWNVVVMSAFKINEVKIDIVVENA